MRTGAVITAAGLSTRMGAFKQLMKLGDSSIIEHVVRNFQAAKVDKIVVVTGYRQEDVENALSSYDVTFVHNDKYETTQMFDSVKLGLMKIMDTVEKILITPCDIVEFDSGTVEKLISIDRPLVMPSYAGKTGHPICISASLATDILKYDGQEGLRGAIKDLEIEPWQEEVGNDGILKDLDTMDDYERVKKLHEWK